MQSHSKPLACPVCDLFRTDRLPRLQKHIKSQNPNANVPEGHWTRNAGSRILAKKLFQLFFTNSQSDHDQSTNYPGLGGGGVNDPFLVIRVQLSVANHDPAHTLSRSISSYRPFKGPHLWGLTMYVLEALTYFI